MADVDDIDYVLLVPPANFGGGDVFGVCFFNSYFEQPKIRNSKN